MTEIEAIQHVIERHNVLPNSGVILRQTKRGKKLEGKPMGSLESRGYVQIGIIKNGVRRGVMVHRVIFYAVHNYLPQFIDHVDGNKTNNQINNLRKATKSENGYNRKEQANNTSGKRGVSKQKERWMARITVDKKRITLGSFQQKSDAILAREKAELRFHTKFIPHYGAME